MKNQDLTKITLSRQPYFMRLSLMDNELSSMLAKLRSYRCEPCTSDMYDQYLELNNHGRLLKQAIDKAKVLAQDSMEFSKNIGEEINGIMRKYHTFQKSLTSYLTEAIAHH